VRSPFGEIVEKGRVGKHPIVKSGPGDRWGFFELEFRGSPLGSTVLRVLASEGDEQVPWEHVSVSTRTRCPTWDEMCFVKDLFFEEDETVIQFHLAKSDYINFHKNCLHLWRPTQEVLPIPPTIAVGPKSPAELKEILTKLGLSP
jgi:hypothetical protein